MKVRMKDLLKELRFRAVEALELSEQTFEEGKYEVAYGYASEARALVDFAQWLAGVSPTAFKVYEQMEMAELSWVVLDAEDKAWRMLRSRQKEGE